MSHILATWIYLDTKESASYFPSSKGLSSDLGVQAIYWRCVVVFFSTARYYNKDIRLALFSNVSTLPQVEGADVGAVLKKLGVEFYTTPFEYQTPEGYYGNWRNQFYEFSIFKYVTTSPAFCDDDNFVLLDSDCVIKGDLSPVFNAVALQQCITYVIYYKPERDINGISRLEMKDIFERLSEKPMQEPPLYHAGEFYATTVKAMKQLMQDFYIIWPRLVQYHAEGKTRLTEEAHVLSYLYYINGFKAADADRFVKRIWTDAAVYRNVEAGDKDLLIWHLPSEKRGGFKELFHRLKQKGFDLQAYKSGALTRELERIFKIPYIPLQYQLYYSLKKLGKKMYKTFKK